MTLRANLFAQARIPAMFPDVEVPKKIYSSPVLTKRSREQARLFLVGHAWIENSAARNLLKPFFPEPGQKITKAAPSSFAS
jgi:hypothetical protein